MNGKLDPRGLGEERRGRTIKDFARRQGISENTIKRAISWGLINVIYFGDRPIIPADEDERIGREGLPHIPPGYKRKTKGPWPGGRPRSSKGKTAAKAGKPASFAGKMTPPRRPKRGEDRATT
jgi:hypothetical protein